MEEPLVLRVGGPLVGNEFNFHSLHWSDCKDGLGDTGSEATEQPGGRRQVSLLVHHVLLELFKGPEPDCRLGNTAIHEDREAAVETSDSILFDCLFGAVCDAFILAKLLI